ncbi:MAG TPA: TIGR03435 family protein [Verrucomicrobiae bacterium]|nr:TIGR03435 family protein [Verrucomicrobiae bacterium]
MKNVILTAAVSILVAPAFGQPARSFEAASLKVAAPPTDQAMAMIGRMKGGPGSADPGQISWFSMSLRRLILTAFEREDFEISAPSWMGNAKYDITAKLPPETTTRELHQMLQGLLAERLALKAHHETRDLQAYELTVLKGGLRMKPAAPPPAGSSDPRTPASGDGQAQLRTQKDANGIPELPPGYPLVMAFGSGAGHMRVSSRMQTMEDIDIILKRLLHLTIVDETGLSGKYDFNLDFLPEGAATTPLSAGAIAAPADAFPDLISAVELQLGLTLEKKITPQDVLVVDSAEKAPIEN